MCPNRNDCRSTPSSSLRADWSRSPDGCRSSSLHSVLMPRMPSPGLCRGGISGCSERITQVLVIRAQRCLYKGSSGGAALGGEAGNGSSESDRLCTSWNRIVEAIQPTRPALLLVRLPRQASAPIRHWRHDCYRRVDQVERYVVEPMLEAHDPCLQI